MVTIAKAKPEDAAELLACLKQCGGETDNLTFGAEGMPFTVQEEEEFLRSLEHSRNAVMLVARLDGKIVGSASFTAPSRERLKHRGQLAVSVLKEAWGMGIGTKLMDAVIDFAKHTAQVEILHLEVRSDNLRAIRLYEKLGFRKTGVFHGMLKINGELIDCDLMDLYLSL